MSNKICVKCEECGFVRDLKGETRALEKGSYNRLRSGNRRSNIKEEPVESQGRCPECGCIDYVLILK
ncbi:MAG: hypothetical protein PHY59_00825 [Methanobacterium sp.]|nr:hypothetical protein [Methanobacterium sp.]